MELQRYEIPYAGNYALNIRGLKPGERPAGSPRIVFTRPNLARVFPGILWLLFCALLGVGCIVLFGPGITKSNPVPIQTPGIAARRQ